VERCLFLRRSRASTDQGRKDFLRCVRFTDQNSEASPQSVEPAGFESVARVRSSSSRCRNTVIWPLPRTVTDP
jgi:hypothetical protein